LKCALKWKRLGNHGLQDVYRTIHLCNQAWNVMELYQERKEQDNVQVIINLNLYSTKCVCNNTLVVCTPRPLSTLNLSPGNVITNGRHLSNMC